MKTFYIKQRIFTITDRYFVYDQYQQPTYEVNGKFFTIGDELTLTNLKGDELFRIKQRIMSLFGAYDVYKQNKLCATIKRRATLFRPKLDIESDDGNFEIEGDFWDYNFSILKDGHTIGTIEKERFLGAILLISSKQSDKTVFINLFFIFFKPLKTKFLTSFSLISEISPT